MADKKFGVKQIDLIGASGTPNLTSPNNLNLNAVTVAISTDVTIGGQVTSNIIVGTGKSIGIGTTVPTGDLDVRGQTNLSNLNVSGVSTFAGITTVTGSTLFSKQLNVSGVSTIPTLSGNVTLTGTLTADGLSLGDNETAVFGDSDLIIKSDGNKGVISGGLLKENYLLIQNPVNSNYIAKFQPITGDGSDNVELYHSGSKKFETIGAGVTVTGTTFTNQLNVSGFSTFISNVRFANSSGVSTYVHNIGPSYITGYDTSAGYQNDIYLNFSPVTSNYILRNVGIGTTNPLSGYNLTVGNDSLLSQVSNSLKVHGYGEINGLVIKGNSTTGTTPYYSNNVIITQHPAATFTGDGNVAIGDYSFTKPGAAKESVALGYFTLNSVGNNITGSAYAGNTGIGAYAGQDSTTTIYNTLIGWSAGRYITTGDYNVILGSYDGNSGGLDIRTSSNNVVLSDGAGNIKLVGNLNGVGIGTTNPTSALEVGGTIKDSIGNVRSIPQNAQTSAYILAVTDVGKHVAITTGGITVPSSTFSAGDNLTIFNNSDNNQMITPSGGVTLRRAGVGDTGVRGLNGYGLATILCIGSNSFVITGAGLT